LLVLTLVDECITLVDECITAITRFHLNDLYPPLGFPAQLSATGAEQSASRPKTAKAGLNDT